MKKAFALIALTCLFSSVQAAGSCAERAAEKKLAGAAKNSFMKKCEADGKTGSAACEATAKEKKLAGAAKNSFVKKCTADAQDGAK